MTGSMIALFRSWRRCLHAHGACSIGYLPTHLIGVPFKDDCDMQLAAEQLWGVGQVESHIVVMRIGLTGRLLPQVAPRTTTGPLA
jgi:hypothetical protein